MIKKIIVPTDGSEHATKAVSLAADLAARYGAQMVILHVLLSHASTAEIRELADAVPMPDSVMKHLDELDQALLDAASAAYGAGPISMPVSAEALSEVGERITAQAMKEAEAKGVSGAVVRIVAGSPAESILEAAEAEGADMIVMGSRGLGRLSGLMMGSVSHKVSHLSKCTCVTVK